MKIGDTVYVHGYIDEIRKDIIIIKNKGGYFGTDKSEVVVSAKDMEPVVRCKDCKWSEKAILDEYCVECTMYHTSCMRHGYCHHGERKGGDDE